MSHILYIMSHICSPTERLSCGIAVDAFGGVGGSSVQLAGCCSLTIATDISMDRLLLAKHNAAVYGVGSRLDFVCGDFLRMAPHFQVLLATATDCLRASFFLHPEDRNMALTSLPTECFGIFDVLPFGFPLSHQTFEPLLIQLSIFGHLRERIQVTLPTINDFLGFPWLERYGDQGSMLQQMISSMESCLTSKTALQADAVFLAPPWGGPQYNAKSFDVSQDIGNLGASYQQLIHVANSALQYPLDSLAPLQGWNRDPQSACETATLPVTGREVPTHIAADDHEPHQPEGQIRQSESDRAEAGQHVAQVPPREKHAPGVPAVTEGQSGILAGLTDDELFDMVNKTLAALEGGSEQQEEPHEPEFEPSSTHREELGTPPKAVVECSALEALAMLGSDKSGLSGAEAAQNTPAPRSSDSPAHCKADGPREQGPIKAQAAKMDSRLGRKGIACFLPKSTDLEQLSAAVVEGSFCEVERNFLNGRLKSVTVYHD